MNHKYLVLDEVVQNYKLTHVRQSYKRNILIKILRIKQLSRYKSVKIKLQHKVYHIFSHGVVKQLLGIFATESSSHFYPAADDPNTFNLDLCILLFLYFGPVFVFVLRHFFSSSHSITLDYQHYHSYSIANAVRVTRTTKCQWVEVQSMFRNNSREFTLLLDISFFLKKVLNYSPWEIQTC